MTETQNDPKSDRSHSAEDEMLMRVGAYVDGELSPEERESVEKYVDSNASAREVADSYRWLDEVSRGESAPPVSGEQWARVWDEIQRRKNEPELETPPAVAPQAHSSDRGQGAAARIERPRFLYGVVAAAAAVLVIAVLLIALRSPPSTGPETNVATGTAVEQGDENTPGVQPGGGEAVPEEEQKSILFHGGDKPSKIDGNFASYEDF